MIFNYETYQDILQSSFEQRRSANLSYSLRAFSRDIGISPGSLSEILNGNQGLSLAKAEIIAKKLGLSETEKDYFLNLIESKHARGEARRKAAALKLTKYKTNQHQILDLDAIKIISDWYHFAILELTHLKIFKPNIKWVARALAISEKEAEEAVIRLEKMGLLKIETKKWVDTQTFLATTDGVPSSSIRNLHLQMIQKAQLAVMNQNVEERDSTAIIFSMNKNSLPLARKILKEARRKLSSLAGQDQDKDSVYCLSLNLFNLTTHPQEDL